MSTPRLESKYKPRKESRKPEPRPVPALVLEMQSDPFMLPSEIAEIMHVDPKTVTSWCKKGKFGGAPDVIRLPSKTGHHRIRTSAFARAIEDATELPNE